MGRLGDLIVNVGANTKDLNNKLGDAQKRIGKTMGNISRVGAGMSAAVTAPLVALGAKSFSVASEFEASMAKVQAVSGATGASFQALEQDALRLGSSTSFTASEVSALQLEFAKLGFTSEEITKVTESTLNLAKATGSDLATSAEVAGATLRGFGLDAEETSRVTDVMAASFSSTALDMSSFKDAMKFVAPVAKSAGVSIEETTAMLGSLANAGIKGSQAGTALRRIISDLGSTGGDVSGAIKDLASQGLNLADAKDEVGRSAQSALLVLAKSGDQTDTLTQQFGNAAGSASNMAKIMDNTAAGSMARMQSAIEGAQIKLGDALAPVLLKVSGFVEKAANAFTKLDSKTQTIIATVLGIVSAIGPLLVLLPGLATAATTIGPLIAGAFTAMISPIGLAVGAIAAITAAIFYFWDDVKEPLTNVINTFIELYNQNEVLRVALAVLSTTFKSTFKIAQTAVMTVVNSFKTLFRAIKTAITDGFGAAFDVLTEGFSDIKDGVVEAGKEIGEDFKDAVEEAITKDPVELITTDQLDAAKDKFTGLFDFFSGAGATAAAATPTIAPVIETDQVLVGIQEIEEEFEEIDDLDFDTDKFQKRLEFVKQFTENVMADIQSAVQNAAASLVSDLGQALGDVITKGTDGVNLMGTALEGLADLLQSIGKSLIAQASAMIVFKKELFKNPGVALAAGVAFVAAGAVLKNKAEELGAPALAKGGVAFGPTMALIGDNKNARIDPEVVAPLSKLSEMMGGNQVEVFGRISGNDIFLSNSRAGTNRNRYA